MKKIDALKKRVEELEEALAALRADKEDQLAHARKMDAIAQLAGGVAHNFNNLLAVMMPAIEMTARQVPAAAEHLAPAREAASQAAAIVRELQRLAGAESRTPRSRRDPAVLVRKTVEFCKRTFDRWIQWELELDPSLPRVRLDAAQIEQCLLNVLLNARDALRARPGRAPTITVRAHASEGLVHITVKDNGPGMDDAVRARIFEPFFTTKRTAVGAGLGLSTAYAIVKEHGGAIACTSVIDEGTTFTLSLPVTDSNEPSDPVVGASVDRRGRGEHVLVVDDEALVRRVLRRVLEEVGYHVLEAEDGERALSVLGDRSVRVDAVILDQSMPGLRGSDVMAWVTRARPELRVIGYSAVESAIPGVRAMLAKPAEPDTLLATVRAVLDAP